MPISRSKRTRQLDGFGRGEARVMRQYRDVNGGHVRESADARRADVYRTDVPFADHEPTTLPAKGSHERIELALRVVALRAEGLTYTKISEQTGVEYGQVPSLITEGRILGDGTTT